MQRWPQLRCRNSRQKNQQKKGTTMNPLTQFKIFKKIPILPLLIPVIFACFALSPTAQAITDARAEDTHNKYKNVGTFIVIRGPNPIGLPEGIAATVTAVLIHERVLLSAGHFVARAYNNGNGVPFFSRVVVSFSPDNALDPSTWIPVPSAASAWVPHPSFPMPCSPQDCPFDDTDGLPEPGIADIGLTFLDAPVNIEVATIASYSVSNPPYEGDKQKQVGYGLVEAPPPGTLIFDGLFDGIRRIGMSTPSVIDENWNSYARDPSGTCHGDSGAPTFFDGEVIDIASDGNEDCATGDVRARVDTPEVRAWIFDTIAARLGN
jgi:hypothetical protein